MRQITIKIEKKKEKKKNTKTMIPNEKETFQIHFTAPGTSQLQKKKLSPTLSAPHWSIHCPVYVVHQMHPIFPHHSMPQHRTRIDFTYNDTATYEE